MCIGRVREERASKKKKKWPAACCHARFWNSISPNNRKYSGNLFRIQQQKDEWKKASDKTFIKLKTIRMIIIKLFFSFALSLSLSFVLSLCVRSEWIIKSRKQERTQHFSGYFYQFHVVFNSRKSPNKCVCRFLLNANISILRALSSPPVCVCVCLRTLFFCKTINCE